MWTRNCRLHVDAREGVMLFALLVKDTSQEQSKHNDSQTAQSPEHNRSKYKEGNNRPSSVNQTPSLSPQSTIMTKFYFKR